MAKFSLNPIDTSSSTSLIEYFLAVRAHTESLAGPLSPEDQTVQSMPDTSPTKWHRAHITWFFETFILEKFEQNFARYDDIYNFLFNSYYEQVGDRFPRPERGLISRPSVAEVGAYRRNVDDRMVALLKSASESQLAEIAQLVVLGCNHEQQHQELMLMDIKHVLSINPIEPAYTDAMPAKRSNVGELTWTSFEGGLVDIGVDECPEAFSFDNEGPKHQALIHPFKLADRLITCGEWLDFMADDGYHRSELWLSEGWHHRNTHSWEAPLYWKTSETGWRVHTLSGTHAVDYNEPVRHISFYEADAYATWAKARLATEFEWEHAARLSGAEANGRGECWEWTESSYRPYPGFVPCDGAIGEYNGKFMINQMVLRGGCAFTPPGHARITYRNFFPTHTRWHLSGVRLASNA